MVDPTKRKPRRRKSWLMASDSAVWLGYLLQRAPLILFGNVSDELPDVSVECAKFLLNKEKGLAHFGLPIRFSGGYGSGRD